AGGRPALPQAVNEIEVREVAHIGVRIPTGIGRDVEYISDINACTVRRHQVSPGYSFARHRVVTVQLQRHCRLLRSDDIAPALSAPRKRDIRNLCRNTSWLPAVSGIEFHHVALPRHDFFPVFGREALHALGCYWSECSSVHSGQIRSCLLSGLPSSNQQVLAIGKPESEVVVEARL